MSGGRPKGLPKTGGRTAGTPNKLNADLREMIFGALNGVGGQEYLERQAEANPAAFLALVGKILPPGKDSEGGTVILLTGIRRQPIQIEHAPLPAITTGVRRNGANGNGSHEDC